LREYRWLVLAVLAGILVVGTLGNELRVQDWDPQYTRTAVERQIEYGGTYYENAIINKGPLEPFVYDAASWVTSDDGYWLAIAAISTLLSAAIAWAVGWTAFTFGTGRWIALLAALVALIHFSFSPAAYAGVVYVRNLTVVLLAACWVLIFSDRAWSTRGRRVATTLAIAAIIALAVQSLLTTMISGVVLLVATIVRIRRRTEPWEALNLTGIGMIAGVLVFVSAPIWYWLRGAIEEFWTGWWVYSTYLRAATGSDLVSQLQFGWDQIYAYYQVRPLLFGIILATAIATVVGWREWSHTRRLAHVAVLAWWAAAWLELMLTERYSSHYFSVTAVPTAIMAALLLSDAARRLDLSRLHRHRMAWSALVLAVVAYLSGPGLPEAFGRALEFRGVGDLAYQRDAQLDGNGRTALAVLDLVSSEGDPLLGWTNDPWPYLELERVSATRFIWKSFMVGEIYLAPGGGPEYVLPQTWDWFYEDLAESNPMALARVGHPIDPNTPFAELADARFKLVYDGDPVSLSLVDTAASSLIDSSGGLEWGAPRPVRDDSGWAIEPGSAVYTAGNGPAEDLLPLGSMCSVIEGAVTWPPEGDAILAFVFEDPRGVWEALHIGIDRGRAFSGSEVVMYAELPLGDAGIGRKEFRLVIGHRSAALVVAGEVVAAVRLLTPMDVQVQPRADTVGLVDIMVGAPPPGSGC
jgi:hypothetical protein